MELLQPHAPLDLNQNRWLLMFNHFCNSRRPTKENEESNEENEESREENEAESDEESSDSQVIPGVPDEIAYECLLRTPLQSHHAMSRVSSRWRRLLRGVDFYSHRSQHRLADTWICALARDSRYTNTIRAFDLNSKAWISLPPMPENRHRRAVGQEIAVVSGKIIVCGGWRETPLDSVSIFDPVSYSWYSGPPMLSPRAHFVSGVIGDKLYVAGGGDGKQPRSAEAEFFDPVENKWFPVASLETGISFCLGVSVAGKLFVQARGGVPRETMVLLPEYGMWSAVRSNMLAWPHRPHAVLDEELVYRSDVKEGKHELMVYDGQTDGWNSVGAIENGPSRRISEIVGVGGQIWCVAEDFSVGLLKLEMSGGIKYVRYMGGVESSERLICCRVLVR